MDSQGGPSGTWRRVSASLVPLQDRVHRTDAEARKNRLPSIGELDSCPYCPGEKWWF